MLVFGHLICQTGCHTTAETSLWLELLSGDSLDCSCHNEARYCIFSPSIWNSQRCSQQPQLLQFPFHRGHQDRNNSVIMRKNIDHSIQLAANLLIVALLLSDHARHQMGRKCHQIHMDLYRSYVHCGCTRYISGMSAISQLLADRSTVALLC